MNIYDEAIKDNQELTNLIEVIIMKNKIAELRKAHNMSQTDLANEVFVSRQTITSLEIGKYNASLELAYKIAKFFKLAIEDVFDFSELEELK